MREEIWFSKKVSRPDPVLKTHTSYKITHPRPANLQSQVEDVDRATVLMKTFFSETNFLTNVFVMYVALRTVTFTAYTHLSLLLLTRLESSIWIKIKIPSSTLLCPTIAMHHEIIGNVSQIWPNCNMCIGDWAHSSLTVNICVIVACTSDYLKVHSLIGAVRRREGDSASQCFSPSVRDHYQAPSHYPY